MSRGGWRPGAGRKRKDGTTGPREAAAPAPDRPAPEIYAPKRSPNGGKPKGGALFVGEELEEKRRLVAAMVAYGIPQEDIAAVIGLTRENMRANFSAEILTAAPVAHSRVGEFIYNSIVNGTAYVRYPAEHGVPGAVKIIEVDPETRSRLAIFYAKTRMGWAEAREAGVGERPHPSQVDRDARDRTFALVDQAARRISSRVAGEDASAGTPPSPRSTVH